MKDLFIGHGRITAVPFLAVMALAAVPLNLPAADLNCEGCTSETMGARALSAGPGQHRVYSIDPPLLHAYRVYCPDAAAGGASTAKPLLPDARTGAASRPATCTSGNALVVEQQQPDALTVEAFDAAIAFYSQVGAGARKSLVVGGRSSVEFVAGDGSGSFADSVAGIVSDYPQRSALASHLMQAIPVFLRSPLDSSIVDVTFKDSSFIQLLYTAETRSFEPVRNSAKGPDGQELIEANEQNFAGDYFFSSAAALDTYTDYLSFMGIAVSGSGNRGYSCLWNPAANSLACTRVDS